MGTRRSLVGKFSRGSPYEIIDASAKLGQLTDYTYAGVKSLEKFVILLYWKAIPITAKTWGILPATVGLNEAATYSTCISAERSAF